MKAFLIIFLTAVSLQAFSGEREESAMALFTLSGGLKATDEEVILIASVMKNRVRNPLIQKGTIPNMHQAFYDTGHPFPHAPGIPTDYFWGNFTDTNPAWVLAGLLANGNKVEDKDVTGRWNLCVKYATGWFPATTKATVFVPRYFGIGGNTKFTVVRKTDNYEFLMQEGAGK